MLSNPAGNAGTNLPVLIALAESLTTIKNGYMKTYRRVYILMHTVIEKFGVRRTCKKPLPAPLVHFSPK